MMPTLGVWDCPVLLVAIASVKRYSWLMGPTVWKTVESVKKAALVLKVSVQPPQLRKTFQKEKLALSVELERLELVLLPWFAWVMSALSQDLAVLKQSTACVDQVKLGLLEIAVLVSMVVPGFYAWECLVLLVV